MLKNLIDKAFNRFARVLLDQTDQRMLHPKRLLLEQAQQDSAAYARDHMAGSLVLDRRAEILDLAVSRMPSDGLILEFGVADGDSIRHLAARTVRAVHGFDSFEGLPEDWGGRHEGKGHYTTGGRLPTVPANVTLHKGWFDDTLAIFLRKEPAPVALLHVDCDLYSSTKSVLSALAPRMRQGTVIVFDEYFNFIGWRDHEFRAFHEFIDETGLEYSYLAWAYQQAIVIIGDVPE